MSEFKFACPVCGQHIKCDSTQSGTRLECPTCFQKVVVPQAPATEDPKFILTGSKASKRPIPAAAAAVPESAVPAKKSLVAPVLLVVFVLVCAGGAMVFATRDKAAKATKSVEESGEAGGTKNPAAVPPAVPEVAVSDANWMLDLANTAFPDTAASGRIHGRPFVSQRAILEGGTLTLRMPGKGQTVAGLSLYLHATRSTDLAGQSVNISSTLTNAPQVRLRWLDEQGQNKTQDFRNGYALHVEFGQLAGNRLLGKMYLCTPDDAKSYVAGTFNAEIRAPKPPKRR